MHGVKHKHIQYDEINRFLNMNGETEEEQVFFTSFNNCLDTCIDCQERFYAYSVLNSLTSENLFDIESESIPDVVEAMESIVKISSNDDFVYAGIGSIDRKVPQVDIIVYPQKHRNKISGATYENNEFIISLKEQIQVENFSLWVIDQCRKNEPVYIFLHLGKDGKLHGQLEEELPKMCKVILAETDDILLEVKKQQEEAKKEELKLPQLVSLPEINIPISDSLEPKEIAPSIGDYQKLLNELEQLRNELDEKNRRILKERSEGRLEGFNLGLRVKMTTCKINRRY